MNNIFKVIFSQSQQKLVVVSELAKGKVKSQSNGQNSSSSSIISNLFKFNFIKTALALAVSQVVFSDYAFAAGENSTEVGRVGGAFDAYALTYEATADGNEAVAVGVNSFATGNKSVVVGKGAIATAEGKGGIAIGHSAKTQSGGSIAIGISALVDPGTDYSIALGSNARVQGQNSFALGHNAQAKSQNAYAFGTDSIASGANSYAIGVLSKAIGGFSLTLGSYSESRGEGSIAMGKKTKALSDYVTAIGFEAGNNSTQGDASVYIGQQAGAKGNHKVYGFDGWGSTFIGQNAGEYVNGDANIGLGSSAGANTEGSQNIFIGDTAKTIGSVTNNLDEKGYGNRNLVIGNHYVNAKVSESDGTANYINDTIAFGTLAKATANQSIAIGSSKTNGVAGAMASGERSIAIGVSEDKETEGAKASGIDSIAFGTDARANNTKIVRYDDSRPGEYGSTVKKTATGEEVVIGSHAISDAPKSIVIGSKAHVGHVVNEADTQGVEGIAIGSEASSTKNWSVAIGKRANGSGQSGLAIGRDAQAGGGTGNGIGAVALGGYTKAIGETSIALGFRAEASENDAIAQGYNSKATADSAVALGANSVANKAAAQKDAVYKYAAVENHADKASLKTAIENTVKGSLGAISVGKADATRQIINLAAGSADTDAVNVAQLTQVANTPIIFADESDNKIERKLGSKIKFVGDGNYIQTEKSGNDIKIKIKQAGDLQGGDEIQVDGAGKLLGSDLTLSLKDGSIKEGKLDPTAVAKFTKKAELVAGTNTTVTGTGEKGNPYQVNVDLSSVAAATGKKNTVKKGNNITIEEGKNAGGGIEYTISADLSSVADKNLSNLTTEGNTVIKNLAIEAVTLADGTNTTVSSEDKDGNKVWKVNVKGTGTVADNDTGLISGGTLYTETHVDNGNYIQAGNTVAGNLKALDGQVKTNADNIALKVNTTDVHNIVGDTMINVDQGSILAGDVHLSLKDGSITEGKLDPTAVAKFTKKAELAAGNNTTVEGTGETGNPYKVNVDLSDVAKIVDLDAYAKKDASNIAETDKTAWENTLGTGLVTENSNGLIKGDTLYKEVHVATDGTYVKGDKSVAQNLTALDTQVKSNKDAIDGIQNIEVTGTAGLSISDNKNVRDGKVTITLNADGTVASGETKLVNGGTVYNAIEGAKTELTNLGFKLSGDEGDTVHKNLGESIKLKGDDNIKTKGVNTSGEVQFTLAKTLTGITSITGNGTTATFSADGIRLGNKKITGLADGTANSDAVNYGQLEKVKTLAGQKSVETVTGENGIEVTGGNTDTNKAFVVKLDTTTKNKIDNALQGLTSTDKTVKITGNGTTKDLSVNIDGTTIVKNNEGVLSVGEISGAKITNNTITGDKIVNKTISKEKLDDSVQTSLGKADTALQSVYDIEVAGNAGLSLSTEKNVGNGKVTITLNADGAISNGETKLVNGGTVYNAIEGAKTELTNLGFKLSGDEGDTVHKNLGESIKLKGDDNIKTKGVNTSGEVQFTLAKTLTGITSIAGNGTTATFGEDGIGLGNKKITGLADGTANSDAVNYGQLEKVKTLAGQKSVETVTGENGITVEGGTEATNKAFVVKLEDEVKTKIDNALQSVEDIDSSDNSVVVTGKNVGTGKVDLKVATTTLTESDGTISATDTGTKFVTGDNIATTVNSALGNQKIKYGANSDAKKSVKLSEGFAFTNGTNTTAVAEENGVVKFNVNDTLTGMKSISNGTGDAGAKISLGETDKNVTFNGGKLTGITSGDIANNDNSAITGGKLYNEVHVDKDGNYIKSSNTVAGNLKALDEVVKDNKDAQDSWNDLQLETNTNLGNLIVKNKVEQDKWNQNQTEWNEEQLVTNTNLAKDIVANTVAGFNLSGDDGDTVHKNLGGTIKLNGDHNIKTKGVNDEGEVQFALAKTLTGLDSVTVGEKGEPGVEGKPGKPGSITIVGEKGINGKDGQEGTNGADGKNAIADIKVVNGKDGIAGVDGKNGITRIEYKDEGGNDHTIATLEDGLKFVGDDGTVIAKKLNTTLGIKGGVVADDGITDEAAKIANIKSKLTDGNIGVVKGTDGLEVKLAKDLKDLKSIAVTDKVIVGGESGITISSVAGTGADTTREISGLTNTTFDKNSTGKNGRENIAATEGQLQAAINDVNTTIGNQNDWTLVEADTTDKKYVAEDGEVTLHVKDANGKDTAVKDVIIKDVASKTALENLDDFAVKYAKNPDDSKNPNKVTLEGADGTTLSNVKSSLGDMTKEDYLTKLEAAKQNLDTAKDAVNISDLANVAKGISEKGLQFGANTGDENPVTNKLGSKVTVKGTGTKDDANYDSSNIKTKISQDSETGNTEIEIMLAKELALDKVVVGKAGADGVDGAIGINGKDGTSGIIKVESSSKGLDGSNGTNGLDGQDGLTRIVYEGSDGKDHTIATLDDGLKFKGDDTTVIAKKLNEQLEIIGGATGDLTDSNIAVKYDDGKLHVKLAKNLKDLKSIAVTDKVTVGGENGIKISSVTDAGTTTREISGLTNTKWLTDGHTVKADRAATEGQLQAAINEVNTNVDTKTFGLTDDDGKEITNTLGNEISVKGDDSISTAVVGNDFLISLKDNISVGKAATDGKPGVDGAIGVNGADGKSSVAINGKDGISVKGEDGTSAVSIKGETGDNGTNGVIGLDGHDGVNGKDAKDVHADIKVMNGQNGVDGTDGNKGTDGMTRIVYEDKNGKNHEVATLDDGLKFGANAGDTNPVANKLGSIVTITGKQVSGEVLDKTKYASDNVRTVVTQDEQGNTNVEIMLAKDLTANTVTVGEKGVPGEDGKPGKAGSITIVGEKGINGKDGQAGTNGADGKNAVADIKVVNGKDGIAGVDGKNGITRVVYVDEDGKDHTVATMEDGLKFKGDDETVIAKKLNEQLEIIGGATGDLTDSNIAVKYDDGKLHVKLAKDLKDLKSIAVTDKVTVGGEDGITISSVTDAGTTTREISGLTNTKWLTDGHTVKEDRAATEGQLQAAINEVNTNVDTKTFGLTDDDGKEITNTLGNEISVKGDDSISTAVVGNDFLISLKDNISVGKAATDGKPGVDGAIGVNGADGKSSVAINGKDGISVKGEDGTSAVSIKGETGDNGTNGVIGLDGHDGVNGKDAKDVHADIKVMNGQNGVDGTDGSNGTDGMTRIVYEDKNGIDHEVATLDDGLIFAGNDAKDVTRKLNSRLTIKGEGVDETASGAFKSAAGNINVVQDGEGGLEIRLNKELRNIDSLTFAGGTTINNTGLIIKNGPSVTTAGINAGNKVISNVADGVKNSDAVNKGQLDTAIQNVATEAAKHSTVTGVGNIAVKNTAQAGEAANYEVSLKDSITLGKDADKQITMDGNNGKLSVGDKTSIENGKATFGDIHIGSTDDKGNIVSEISGLGNTKYVDGTTGVNGREGVAATEGQLKNVADQITTINSEISDVKAKGFNLSGDKGNTVHKNLGESIKLTGDDNITTEGINDKGEVQISLNNDVKVNSVTTGNTNIDDNGVTIKDGSGNKVIVNNSGLSIDNGPSMTKNGIDAGNKVITNVAPGLISPDSTDAVNGSQLYDLKTDVNMKLNNITNAIKAHRKEANAGSAAAMAAAHLPQVYTAGDSMISAAVGTYRDQQAISVGYSRASDNGKWIIKGSVTHDSQKNFSTGFGVGYKF